MGYSCTQAAMDTLDGLIEVLQDNEPSDDCINTWCFDKKIYYYEIDKSKQSGAIEGEVIEIDCEGRIKSTEKFKIASDGRINTFPGTTTDLRMAGHFRGIEIREKINGYLW